jgi:hypothetical protein
LGVDNTLSLDKLVFESRKIRETLQDIIKGYETVSLITLTTNPFPLLGLKDKAPIPERTNKLLSTTCQVALIPICF